jgi:hypothetical protein
MEELDTVGFDVAEMRRRLLKTTVKNAKIITMYT